MLKKLLFIVVLVAVAVPAAAQQAAPDYAIRNIRSRFLDNNTRTAIEFEVWNIGADATVPATAHLVVVGGTGEDIALAVVRALRSQEIVTVSLEFPTVLFPGDSVQSFRATVGVGEVEAADSRTVTNNTAQISLTIPPVSADAVQPTEPIAQSSGNPIQDALDSLGIQLDISQPEQALVLAVVGGAVLLLFLLLLVILRLIFQRPPDFGTWQLPYSTALPLDPNSAAGRRQAWQSHAQNHSLTATCAEGAITIRKLLLSVKGGNLDKWSVTAARLTHYDMYGRVNRTQTLAPKGSIKRINAVLRRRNKLTPEQTAKRLRPAVHALIKSFQKHLRERTAMLPIALDVRFKSRRGEARIVFELYQCRYSEWQKIDEWEPEITVLSKTMHESYTYALYGQRPEEDSRAFRRRLHDDLTYTLLEMMASGVPAGIGEDTAQMERPPAVD
ncbi:MAG: hypothetical protein K8I60_00775 [Anaerolineae bacterium]|nr:hypothetical protein [Anaerolineae bacterium]